MDAPDAPAPTLDPLALEQKIHAIDRPHPNLLWQFLIFALFTLPAFPLTALILYFRYHTLRYRFDAQGVSISYGILFRREAFLTYARIQDIHLKRNIIERWLGLGTVEVETAGGSGSGPELIQGLTEYEQVRDYLYARMRGATAAPAAHKDESAAALLVEIRDALRDVRAAVKGGAP
jgi:putative membrane protein